MVTMYLALSLEIKVRKAKRSSVGQKRRKRRARGRDSSVIETGKGQTLVKRVENDCVFLMTEDSLITHSSFHELKRRIRNKNGVRMATRCEVHIL